MRKNGFDRSRSRPAHESLISRMLLLSRNCRLLMTQTVRSVCVKASWTSVYKHLPLLLTVRNGVLQAVGGRHIAEFTYEAKSNIFVSEFNSFSCGSLDILVSLGPPCKWVTVNSLSFYLLHDYYNLVSQTLGAIEHRLLFQLTWNGVCISTFSTVSERF